MRQGGVARLANAKPLFLIGPPRSGTTILARILNAHPQILLTNETAVFLQLDESIKKSRQGAKAGILYGKRYHQLWADHLRQNARPLIESYYEAIAAKEGRDQLAYWGEKHPHLVTALDFLEDLCPEATYVYAIRDGRDTACSIAEMNHVPVSDAIRSWCRFAGSYEEFREKLDPDRVVPVVYERLIHDHEGVVREALERLGLTYDPAVASFIRDFQSRDAHRYIKKKAQAEVNYQTKSYRRWTREMSEQEAALANEVMGPYLQKYGYELEAGGGGSEVAVRNLPPKETDLSEKIDFVCNICSAGNSALIGSLERENQSCAACGSSVRLRSLVHLLSCEAYGESLPIDQFPVRPGFKGIDMSGWTGYATPIAHKLGYVNTFYHQPPKFDVTLAAESEYRDLDFVISSDVFEHVEPPISRAFEGAYHVLKPGGALILTVPYMSRIEETIEHFPNLHRWKVKKKRGELVIENRLPNGDIEVHKDLSFHGGVGETLEMRIFAEKSLLANLKAAGFVDVEIHGERVLEYGIRWRTHYSLPVTARRPRAPSAVSQ